VTTSAITPPERLGELRNSGGPSAKVEACGSRGDPSNALAVRPFARLSREPFASGLIDEE
jgi:hypothetical protein